ncbi:MAG: DUF3263 domain-containing protein, partial [Microbacterium gubbeenense]
MSDTTATTVAELLSFEARWPGNSGAKEEAIRAELGITPAHYYARLDRAIDTAPAAEFDPILTRRLLEQRRRRNRRRPLMMRAGTTDCHDQNEGTHTMATTYDPTTADVGEVVKVP